MRKYLGATLAAVGAALLLGGAGQVGFTQPPGGRAIGKGGFGRPAARSGRSSRTSTRTATAG